MTIFEGSIFDCPAEIKVNPVNCVGVMGAGLAKQFAAVSPWNEAAYKAHCARGYMKPGDVYAFHDWQSDFSGSPRYIINAATKNHWRDKSELQWIRKCALGIFGVCVGFKGSFGRPFESIAVPMLGCGLGGLEEDQVFPVLFRMADDIERLAGGTVYIVRNK